MVDVVAIATVAALALLVAGVVGSLLPMVPGPALSVLGVYIYWASTGFSRPGLPSIIAFTTVAWAALAVDYAGGAVAGKLGGAATTSIAVGSVVGFLCLLATGPLGLVVGMACSVFAFEWFRGRGLRGSVRAAVVSAAGVLGSALLQAALTAAMLVAFVLALVLVSQ
jgi:uncharacterized protein YqgC (DUF456 family)